MAQRRPDHGPPLNTNAFGLYAHRSQSLLSAPMGGRVPGTVVKTLPLVPEMQYHTRACGPACLAMILKSLGQPTTQQALDRVIHSQNRGALVQDLIQGAAQFGLTAETVDNCSFDTIRDFIDAGKPMIAFINSDNRLQAGDHQLHYIVIHGYKILYGYRQVLQMIDPWLAQQTTEDFNVFARNHWGNLMNPHNERVGVNRFIIAFSLADTD